MQNSKPQNLLCHFPYKNIKIRYVLMENEIPYKHAKANENIEDLAMYRLMEAILKAHKMDSKCSLIRMCVCV